MHTRETALEVGGVTICIMKENGILVSKNNKIHMTKKPMHNGAWASCEQCIVR